AARAVDDDLAVVVDRAPRGGATLERQAVAAANRDTDVDAVPVFSARTIRARRDDAVLAEAELAGLDVPEVGDRVAAATRQARIHRRGNAVFVIVELTDEQIVGHGEVAEPAAVVADLDRCAADQFS